jgi:hypothetical protein
MVLTRASAARKSFTASDHGRSGCCRSYVPSTVIMPCHACSSSGSSGFDTRVTTRTDCDWSYCPGEPPSSPTPAEWVYCGSVPLLPRRRPERAAPWRSRGSSPRSAPARATTRRSHPAAGISSVMFWTAVLLLDATTISKPVSSRRNTLITRSYCTVRHLDPGEAGLPTDVHTNVFTAREQAADLVYVSPRLRAAGRPVRSGRSARAPTAAGRLLACGSRTLHSGTRAAASSTAPG